VRKIEWDGGQYDCGPACLGGVGRVPINKQAYPIYAAITGRLRMSNNRIDDRPCNPILKVVLESCP
jgi:hypothetical protein